MDVTSLYPPRRGEKRKGDYGRVLVVGGSGRYAGAPAFNALGALRGGADLAIVVAPRRAADLVAAYAPDLITVPCDTPFPDPAVVQEFHGTAHALVVGGGVERSASAHEALLDVIRAADAPLVLDAEALHAVARDPDAIRGKRVLLTPHGGEFEVVGGDAWPKGDSARRDAAKALAARLDATVIVKGRWDVISDGDRVHVDPEGSPFLTKGGYGDLLAGVAGALLARGNAPFDAAAGAAWAVGRAGALAASELGESTFASDALARLHRVLPRMPESDPQ